MPAPKNVPETRGRDPYPTVRKAVSIPGILAVTLAIRWAELFYKAFSPYALELVCYDLKHRRTHPITATIARLPALMQENVDREIVRYFQPGSPEPNGALVQFMMGNVLSANGVEPARGGICVEKYRMRLPDMIWECVPIRVAELGYDSFSAYVTGLIRFDLGFGGPHRTYTGKDMDIDLLRRLNQETVEMFHSRPLRKTRIDYEIERITGRMMSAEEREAEIILLTQNFVGSLKASRKSEPLFRK